MPILLGPPLTGKTMRLAAAYEQHRAAGYLPGQIVCLSFHSANAGRLRRLLRGVAGDFLPWVTTLQRFQTLLLRAHAGAARLPRRAREIEPGARALLLRQAWAGVDGPLWRAFGSGPAGPTPGGLAEFTRVVDWLSQNRTGFRPTPGELGDHELARAYAAYLAACDRHGLLTFQEASLRCLDLLSLPAVAADVRRRFPVLLVDDVHLARPDQLRLIDRLRGLAAHFTATAWLEPSASAPELRAVAQVVQTWQSAEPVEHLPIAPGVNPAITTLIQRATRPAGSEPAGEHAQVPVTLYEAFTVEDELHGVAQAIVRALLADETLEPQAIAVVAPEAGLLPFASRVLAAYGLPLTPRPLPVRQTPLVRAALLGLRWLRHPSQRASLEPELLALPFVTLEPLDRHRLLRAAVMTERAPLSLSPEKLASLGLSAASVAELDALRSSLAALDKAQPVSRLVDAVLAALGVPAWLQADRTFTSTQRSAWERAYAEWRRLVHEFESLLALGLPEPADWLDHLEALTDQVAQPAERFGIQLVPRAFASGVRARLAFVLGLSENALPRQRPPFQLVPEADLPALMAVPGGALLPLVRDQAAWIEREARELALLLSRGVERLWLSTSRYAAAGDAQLPSPFFERLLGADGEIDQDGRLRLTGAGLFAWAEPADPHSAEAWLPWLDVLPASPPRPTQASRLLDDHTFSASQVRAYLTCPLQFYYQRVLNLETEGSDALDRGGLIHELLCVAAGDGTLRAVNLWDRPRPAWMNAPAALSERAMMALEAAWRGEPADLPGGGRYTPSLAWGLRFGPELQSRAVRRWAERLLAEWAEYEACGLPDAGRRRPVLLEAAFRFDLGGQRLVGRIDRIDEVQTPGGPRYEVVDYKTGRGGGDSLTVHLAKFLPPAGAAPADYQLPIYALALMHGAVDGLAEAPRSLNLVFVETLEKTRRGGYSAKACRTLHLVEAEAVDVRTGALPLDVLTGQVAQGLQQTLTSMLASPYPARPGRHCAYCSFRNACERGQSGVEAA